VDVGHPGVPFVDWEGQAEGSGVDDPPEDGFYFLWCTLGQGLVKGEEVVSCRGLVAVDGATEEVQHEEADS
jgi:hypothetical protein